MGDAVPLRVRLLRYGRLAVVDLQHRAVHRAGHDGDHAAGPASRPVGGPWFGPGSGGPGAARSRWATPEAEGAERILAERYARGEISEEEYRSRLEVLRQTGQVGGWAQPRAQEPRQGSAAEPSVASAAWQQSAEP